MSDCVKFTVSDFIKKKKQLSGLDMDPLMDTRAHMHTHTFTHTNPEWHTGAHSEARMLTRERFTHQHMCMGLHRCKHPIHSFTHAPCIMAQTQASAGVHTHTHRVTSKQIRTCTRTRLLAHTYWLWFGIPSLSSSALSFQDGILG